MGGSRKLLQRRAKSVRVDVNDVFVGYLHPNNLSASFHQSYFKLLQYDAASNRRLSSWGNIRTSGYSIPEGRNELFEGFLRTDCKWILMVDADMGFQPDALERLLDVADPVERPVVGGLCFAYRDSGEDGYGGFRSYPLPTIYDWVEHPDGLKRMTGRKHYPVNSLIRCAGTGAAFILIHRSAVERVKEEYGPTWFDRLPGPDGLLGEDISFCYRLGALGVPIHVNTGVRTTHHKNIWVSEPDFWLDMQVPPATDSVDVVVPTVKERFDHLQPLYETLVASTGLAKCWFVVDEDLDSKKADLLEGMGAELHWESGSFPHKLNAWYERSGAKAPWIQVVGDDCRFHPDWFNKAMFVAGKYDAKVVATNDLTNPRVTRGEHATHPLINRRYVEEVGSSWGGPGVFCHEGYAHNFVDDELVAVAKQRGVFQAALGSIVEHFHPLTQGRPADATDEKNQATFKQDGKLFRTRFHKYG